MKPASRSRTQVRGFMVLRAVALAAQQLGVHEATGLIIRDEADFEALIAQMPRKAADGGGFAGSEEAADHDVARALRHSVLVFARCGK